MTPKQRIASEANWNKKIVEGAIANISHINVKDDYSFKLIQDVVKNLRKLSISIEIERDKALAANKNS